MVLTILSLNLFAPNSICLSASTIFLCLSATVTEPDAENDLFIGSKGGCCPAFCAAFVVLGLMSLEKDVLYLYFFLRQSALKAQLPCKFLCKGKCFKLKQRSLAVGSN